MAKRRKTKHWSKKKINNKLFFGSILLLLLCILVVLGTFFQNISWKNLAQNLTNFSFPAPTPIFPHPGHHELGIRSIPSTQLPHGSTTITIYAGNRNDETDANGKPIIHSISEHGVNIVTLDSTMNGRTVEIPIKTKIYLRFPNTTYYDIKITPDKGVVEMPEKIPPSVPVGYSGLLSVVGQGTALLTVKNK